MHIDTLRGGYEHLLNRCPDPDARLSSTTTTRSIGLTVDGQPARLDVRDERNQLKIILASAAGSGHLLELYDNTRVANPTVGLPGTVSIITWPDPSTDPGGTQPIRPDRERLQVLSAELEQATDPLVHQLGAILLELSEAELTDREILPNTSSFVVASGTDTTTALTANIQEQLVIPSKIQIAFPTLFGHDETSDGPIVLKAEHTVDDDFEAHPFRVDKYRLAARLPGRLLVVSAAQFDNAKDTVRVADCVSAGLEMPSTSPSAFAAEQLALWQAYDLSASSPDFDPTLSVETARALCDRIALATTNQFGFGDLSNL